MPSMDYCVFQNTLIDLATCQEKLDNGDTLSAEEARAALRVIRLAGQIAQLHKEATLESLTEKETVSTRPYNNAVGNKCDICEERLVTRVATAKRSGDQWFICDRAECLEGCQHE